MIRLPALCDWFTAEYTEIPGVDLRFEWIREEENRYLLQMTGDLPEPAAVGDWRVAVRPAFEPTFFYTPHLTPEKDNVVDMHVFRTPVLMMGAERRVLCVLPVMDGVTDSENRWYLDLDAPGKLMTLGVTTTCICEHVLYRRTDRAMLPRGRFRFGARFLLLEEEKAENPFRAVLSFWWEYCGREHSRRLPACRDLMPFVRHTYAWAFERWKDVVWQEFDLNGVRVGAPQFIVTASQSPNNSRPASIREHMSIWNQAWFSSLRSAQGLYRYARAEGDAVLLRKALMTKELALSFPQTDGLFDAVIAVPDETVIIDGEAFIRPRPWSEHYFGNSDRNPVSGDLRNSPWHILDMSWTALKMLEWYDELEKDPRLLAYARRYGDRLLRLQDRDGFFPAWIDKSSGEAIDMLRRSPECAVSVTFLIVLSRLTGERNYQDAALACMDALVREVMPESRWEDFETYWSCSRYGARDMVGKKFARNGAYKQCSLSPFWMAQALLACHRAAGRDEYLRWGERCLCEMLMFQSSFQPDYMPVTVVGGFGVMNCDAELNDARQTLFAELILEYGRALGNSEYTERGLAALRAGFSMMYCPENPIAKAQWEARWPFFGPKDYGFMMENYGHDGYVHGESLGIGEFTIYDWGNGAASEAVMRIKEHFPALFDA